MKHFIVPCFVVVEANSNADADALAANFQQINCHGASLLLDEELSTTEIATPTDELPHTMIGVVKEMSDKDKQAKKIYKVLSSQRFADWYKDDGQFGCHITGDAYGATGDIPSDQEILDYIKRTFLV